MSRTKQKTHAKRNQTPGIVGWRFIFVLLALGSVFVVLVARAAYLQVLEPDMLINQGDLRSLRVKSDTVLRGMILDRHGEELAVSVPVQAIWADPKVVLERGSEQDERRWQALADTLNMTPQQLSARIGSDSRRRFVYLQRQVNPAAVDYVRRLAVPGIYFRQESRRFYPAGEVTAHLIGFTDIDDVGVEGIERRFNAVLTGTAGRSLVRRDAKGREIEVLEREDALEPKSLQLSIDQRMQSIAYRELKKAVLTYGASSGSVVIVDVHTGEVLAMVNSPSYNPNNRRNTPVHHFRNRAITDMFEPGSTIKPLPILSALEFGSADLDTVIDTSPGMLRIGGSWVRDVGSNNGKLDLTGIMQKSSNIGVTKLALSMPHQHLLDLYFNMGLGMDTGLGLTGESSGMLSHRNRWSDHELASLSFGYNLSVTAVQLARLYAAIGNGGILRPLTILKSEQGLPGERVLTEAYADAMLDMMEAVVEPGGTATRGRVDGYRVGGKTGTTRKAIAGGYGDDYVASFAGIAPISNPRFATVVVLNEPASDYYHGGEIAAPVFSNIMDAVLRLNNITPDAERVRITKRTGGSHAG
ncbi:penicillin-binding transpeptidase domain-containing protein [Alkalimonas collagenimarina]|uniref:Peptidoglycan D,D-transpeptidase FtsI n=1 Tax=Alkalimonas collagenimarina TaxID=400390 RepID=A0ABT9GZK6_9GAMM|nr:penicillin-binding transpeptidase domain-containing protein [Alkalimonas collagenimarina]MDP4536492.1 penicillin-binding transpeptidase domain-containing protein [Alkalimonas collagenimarina]